MRLISKTHDYYDSLFGYADKDDKDVFVRKPSTFKIPKQLTFIGGMTNEGSVTSGLVGFCGKIIPYIKVRLSGQEWDYVYDYDTFIEKYSVFVAPETKKRSYMCRNLLSTDTLKSWIDDCSVHSYWRSDRTDYRKYDLVTDIFESAKVAYFHVHNELDHPKYYGRMTNVDIYPILRDLMFYRVYDINSAYQNIVMYLSNQLAKPDDPYIEPVPDKIKAQSKGFDRFSFRKEKSK